MKREELIPGPAGKFEDPRIRGRLEAQVFEVKLNEAMEDAFREIHEASTIDNKLTGFVRKAHEEQGPRVHRRARPGHQAGERGGRDQGHLADRQPE